MSESQFPTRTPSGVNVPTTDQSILEPDTPRDETSPGLQDRAKDTASQAAHSLGDIAHDAKDKASDVAGTATKQVKSLADQARSELDAQAQAQQKRAAEGLRALSTELSSMASTSQDPGYATDLVQQVSQTTDRVATWLDERDPGSVVREVKDFARRRPGLFIALAAGAGILVGRLARGIKDAPPSERTPAEDTEGPSTDTPGPWPSARSAAPTDDLTGAHSAGWASEESPLTGPAGSAPTYAASEPVAKHGESDVERL
ncbi:hypothetical protein ACFRCR_08405 [Oerskovia sp. NPDC056781]|uniref:hypothetical protein n=1 Tax=Oerskovia sp. NPDC056781 TaxID=3345942 RepID=UPI0036701624